MERIAMSCIWIIFALHMLFWCQVFDRFCLFWNWKKISHTCWKNADHWPNPCLKFFQVVFCVSFIYLSDWQHRFVIENATVWSPHWIIIKAASTATVNMNWVLFKNWSLPIGHYVPEKQLLILRIKCGWSRHMNHTTNDCW